MFTTIETAETLTSTTCAADPAPQGATDHTALTPVHWWHDCSKDDRRDERSEALAPLAAGWNTSGAQGVIDAARGKTRNGYVSRAWALAMSAVHGPTSTHPDNANHPEVLRVKSNAAADLARYLGV